jgi:thioredoxin-related protein
MRAKHVGAVLILTGALAVPVTAAGAVDGAKPAITWLDDYGATLKQARRDARPIMIEFYTSWCLYCDKLERETFGDPRVAGLAKDFVCAKLDAEVQKAAALRYSPEGYPTVVFAAPNGDEIVKVSGFRPADPFFAVMKVVRDRGPRISELLTAIEKDSKDFAAREALGTIYLDLGLADRAEEHLSVALKSAPRPSGSEAGESDQARIQFLLARAAAAATEYGKAARLLRKLIDANPASPRAPAYYLELGLAYEGAGKEEKAKETFTKLAALFPASPEAATAAQAR